VEKSFLIKHFSPSSILCLPQTFIGFRGCICVCDKAGLSCDDLDLIIPHQANVRIVKTAADRLNIDMSKMVVNLDRYGNTSCASIPICLDELNRSGKLKRGTKIVLAGFGAGLTYGAIAMEW
jgi:3-oxoacyl-[acyl-carrier-protein] synthase-3